MKLSDTGLRRLDERLFACVVPVASKAVTPRDDEANCIADSTPRRRAQFVAGRDAARQVMIALGRSACSVGCGDGGEPLFPADLRGSISHTRELAIALIGEASEYCSVGVDIDDSRPLGEAAASGVTWKSEVALIQQVMNLAAASEAQNFALSAKEAIFKCQYSLTFNSKLSALQARLLANPNLPGELVVAGWRVTPATAEVLARVRVKRLILAAHPVALALIPRSGCGTP